MENNIFAMDLDDELRLKPVPESFDDECDISENVLKDVEENKDHSLLFPGSIITVSAAMVLIVSFSIRFSLSNECLSQLLMLFHLLLPYNTKLCKTIYQFREYFRNLKAPVINHYFCNNYCKKIAAEVACCECGNNTSVFENRSCYIEFSLINQVLCFFKQPGFCEKLKYRFNRNCDSNNLYDIYDGDIYKKHFDSGGQLADLNNISFVLNTDEVPIFKSSNISISPVFLVITELEPKLRYHVM